MVTQNLPARHPNSQQAGGMPSQLAAPPHMIRTYQANLKLAWINVKRLHRHHLEHFG
jgi:hypothetical protein